MTTSPPPPVVVCADAFRALYPIHPFKAGLKGVAICGPLCMLGEYFKMAWLGVIGVALFGGLFVVPHLLRINRFFGSLPCASCGLPAGGHTTVNHIIHLECRHCGHLSRTDCVRGTSGMPTKV